MKSFKRVSNVLRGLAVGGVISVLTAGTALAEPEITLRLGTAGNRTYGLGKLAFDVMAPRLAEYSGGRIELKIHDRGSLCSEHSCVEQVGLGQIDIATVSSGNVGAFGSTFDIINLPFLFNGQDGASKILNGWLAKELTERAANEMGMHVIALVPVGGFRSARQLAGPAPTKKPKHQEPERHDHGGDDAVHPEMIGRHHHHPPGEHGVADADDLHPPARREPESENADEQRPPNVN